MSMFTGPLVFWRKANAQQSHREGRNYWEGDWDETFESFISCGRAWRGAGSKRASCGVPLWVAPRSLETRVARRPLEVWVARGSLAVRVAWRLLAQSLGLESWLGLGRRAAHIRLGVGLSLLRLRINCCRDRSHRSS